MVNIPAQIPDFDSQSPAVLGLFIQIAIPPLGNFNHVVGQFPLTFHQTDNRMSCFTAQLMAFIVQIGTVFMIIEGRFMEGYL